MKLILPEIELMQRMLLSEKQIRDLKFLSNKLRAQSEHFHVFLLGGTGSGKSTLLNCIAGQMIAEVGIQRPTTCELTLYGNTDGLEIPDAKFKAYQARPEDPAILKSLVLWDFPDFDSHQINNHHWSYLFKHYADCIFLVVHPEKTKQESLQRLIEEYPEIPSITLLTHDQQYTAQELAQVSEDLAFQYGSILSVDSIQSPDRTQETIRKYLESIRTKGFQAYKQSSLQNLTLRCEPPLQNLGSNLEKRVLSVTKSIGELTNLNENFSGITAPELFQVFDEKLFAEVKNELMLRLYKTTPGWSILLLEWIFNFRQKKIQKIMKAVAYQALPFYAAQNQCSALEGRDTLLSKFREKHLGIIKECQRNLLGKAQQYSFMDWGLAFTFEVLVPVWLVYSLVMNSSLGTLSLSLSMMIMFMGMLAVLLSGLIRLGQRLRGIYKSGFGSYQHQVQLWFGQVLEEEINALNYQLDREAQSLDSIKLILGRTHSRS